MSDIEALAEAMFTECVYIPNTKGLAGTSFEDCQTPWEYTSPGARKIWIERARRSVERSGYKTEEHEHD